MVRVARLDKSRFLEWCPDVDPRPQIVDALWFHVDRIMEELEAIRNCITNTLDTFIRDVNLTSTSTGEGLVLPGPVDETWMSSLLIPSDLKTALVSQVAVLENVPDEKKDWHPESNNQVLDLLHPSLYCCVFGTTKRIPAREIDSNVDLTVVERMQGTAFKATEVTRRTSSSDNYQWIPSDFAVDVNGHVRILSYINNLHPVTHAAMYDSIAAIFERFVPLFDQVLTGLVAEYYEQPCPFRVPDMSETRIDCTNYLPERLPIPDRIPLESGCPWPYSLKGTTAQVIVKIAEIHLTPENPQYPGGSRHIEGTGSEEIVATGIYYFGCENITDSKLSFRVIVDEPLHVTDDTVGMAAMYGLEDGAFLMQSLGAATAIEDRCLVSPNTFQHKVEPFELADPSKPGVCKILAFFLVNPSKTIPSTSVIPPQQKDWQLLNSLLEAAHLPVESIGERLHELLGCAMTWEDAVTHRKKLMQTRRRSNFFLSGEGNRNAFSLCEH